MTTSKPSVGSPDLNEDGFLNNPTLWNRAVAEELARKNEVWPLTEEHWKIIDFVRNYYVEYAQGPVVYRICQATGISVKRICELFPCGMVRGAYRIAGLPRPAGCA
jgi:tRNA 2-thiouridine synthesizing protein E